MTDLPGGGHLRGGGHWTRDVVFARDGRKMFVSVAPDERVGRPDDEPKRGGAAILEFSPDGKERARGGDGHPHRGWRRRPS